MTSLPPPPDPNIAATEAIAAAADQMRLIVEMVGGYKRQMMEAGFSEGAAETMALILHGEICHTIFGR